MEKIVLLNEQTFEIEEVKIEGGNLNIVLSSASIAELEEAFTNKSIIGTMKVLNESGEHVSSYVGYTRFVSINKSGETGLTTVTMGKVDETQEQIDELKKQIQALTKIVSKSK